MARRTRPGSFSVGLLVAVLLHAVVVLLLARLDVAAQPATQVTAPEQVDAFVLLEDLLLVGERDEVHVAEVSPRAKTLGTIKRPPARIRAPQGEGAEVGASDSKGPVSPSTGVELVPARSTDALPTKEPVRFSLTAGEARDAIATQGVERAREGRGEGASGAQLSRRVERLLQDEQDNHDRKVGLGPGGVVVVALEAAARGGSAPQEGRATFDVFAGPDGQVERVELVGASGDTTSWAAVAKTALAGLKGRKLKVTKGAGGVRVRVALTARVVYPSGSKHRVSARVPFLKRADAPPESPEKSEPITTRNQEPPKPLNPYFWWESMPELSRLQLDRLPMPMVGVAFDTVDLLAPQSRVLTSVVLDEQPL